MTEVEPGRVIQCVRAKPETPTGGCRWRPLGALAYRGDTYSTFVPYRSLPKEARG